MNCQENQKLINLELDRLATGEQKKAVQLHIKECPACAREREELISCARKIRKHSTSISYLVLLGAMHEIQDTRYTSMPALSKKIPV